MKESKFPLIYYYTHLKDMIYEYNKLQERYVTLLP